MVQALFTRNVCVCICVRFQEWVLLQQMMVFIHNICIWRQRSKKNANAKVKCEQGFIHTGCLRDWGRDMDEWVAWFYVEHFILHLNRDRGWHLWSPIVLVPVLSRYLFRHRTQPVWLHQNRRDTILISILVGDALFYLPGKETISISHMIDPLLSQVFEREHERVSADRPTVRSLQRPWVLTSQTCVLRQTLRPADPERGVPEHRYDLRNRKTSI